MGSPFYTYAGLLERSTRLVHMYLRNDTMVVGYQFWGHRTINDAYGNPANSGVGGSGPIPLLRVVRGDTYRSPTLRRKRLGFIEEVRRGTTHVVFDVEDFVAPAVGGSPIPDDGGWMFIRVQEDRVVTGLLNLGGDPDNPVLGPIYCVPPVEFFGSPLPTFTLQGIAPSSTASVAGGLPDLDLDLASEAPRAMILVFPKPLSSLTIHNISAVNLLVSVGPEQTLRSVPAGSSLGFPLGNTKEVVLACPEGQDGAAFTLHGVVTGDMS